MEKIFLFDSLLRKKFNTKILCGVDEVGRGCIAGPLVSAAVIFSDKIFIPHLKESKSVSPEKRKKLFIDILSCAEKVSYSVVSTKIINKFGLNYANWLAMKSAVENIDFIFDIVVVDGYKIPILNKRQVAIIGGDKKSAVVAAASIVAKVLRDRIMEFYDKIFEGYCFNKHKGYATEVHRTIVSKIGLSELHRKYAYKFV
ncbi:MAG: ribonuclease HII [Endomicrobiia bacterium]